MKNATFAWAAGAVLAFGMAVSVNAQTAPATTAPETSADEGGLPSFDSLDTKHAGQLNRSDIPKDVDGLRQLRAHFIQYDTDHNGRISAIEYAAYESDQTPDAQKKPGLR